MPTIDGMPFFDEFWKDALITVFYKEGHAYLNARYACEINGQDRLFDYQRKLDTNDYTVIDFFKEGYKEFTKFYERYTKKLVSYDEFKENYVNVRIRPYTGGSRFSSVSIEFDYKGMLYSRQKKLETSKLWDLSSIVEVNDMIHDLYESACRDYPYDFGPAPEDI